MQTMTSTVEIWKQGKRDISILVSDLYIASPSTPAKMSDFIGEDIRSAKVYRHMDLPIPSVVYELKDGRIAQKLIKSGGSWYTILIFANWQEFDAHVNQNTCIFDPETGRGWK